MAVTVKFPEEGWCYNAESDLGKYLAKRFDTEYKPPGVAGYAWNSFSYWKVNTTSSKTRHSYKNIKEIRNYVETDPEESSKDGVIDNIVTLGTSNQTHKLDVGQFDGPYLIPKNRRQRFFKRRISKGFWGNVKVSLDDYNAKKIGFNCTVFDIPAIEKQISKLKRRKLFLVKK